MIPLHLPTQLYICGIFVPYKWWLHVTFIVFKCVLKIKTAYISECFCT